MKGFERGLQATFAGGSPGGYAVSMLGSHTEWAPLEEFTYSADAGHPGDNHNGHTDKTDQATKVENLRHCAKLSPFGSPEHPHCS